MGFLAIVGLTASGKTRLAMDIARTLADRGERCEIISIDSMCVYRHMDIGTAKPSIASRAEFPHHMIDVAEPEDEYSLALFSKDARSRMEEIAARGAHAVLVGGTGLYVRAVTDSLQLPGRWPDIARQLERDAEESGTAALHDRLRRVDPVGAARMESTNRRRIVRALEVTIGSGRPFSSFGPGLGHYPDVSVTFVGLDPGNHQLDARIAARLDDQISAGFVEEAHLLAARDGELSRTARQALGYRELFAHIRGTCSLDEARDAILARTKMFARRQRRWFRRDPRIAWFGGPELPGDPGTDLALRYWERDAQRIPSSGI